LGLALNSKEFFVLKAHGTIERPETIVLTEKDYATLIHNSPGYRTFLKALFLDRTVLFLGFGLNESCTEESSQRFIRRRESSNGSVNVKEFVALFDEARKASSEAGVLVNPLKTESFEAISAMIKTAASQLEDSVRDQVLEELDRKGWLRQKLPMNLNQMVGEE
jgi:hypothetical protein